MTSIVMTVKHHRVVKILLAASILFCTSSAMAIPPPIPPVTHDYVNAALREAQRFAKQAWAAEMKIWDAQVADAKSALGISTSKQVSEAKSASQETTDSLVSSGEVADKLTPTQEMCASAGGHGATSADAEAKKLAAITLADRQKYANGSRGMSATAQAARVVNKAVADYCDVTSPLCQAVGINKPKPAQRPGNDLSAADQRASSLSADDNTHTADEHDAALAYVNRITGGANIPQALSATQTNTPEGLAYEAQRRTYQAKTDIARSVFFEKIESQRGNVNNYSFLKSLNSATEVVTNSIDAGGQSYHGGKTSSEELARVMATMRADSPAWYKEIRGMNNNHLVYREMALSLAYKLKLQYQQYTFLRKKNIMDAQAVLDSQDSQLTSLRQSRAIAVANQ